MCTGTAAHPHTSSAVTRVSASALVSYCTVFILTRGKKLNLVQSKGQHVHYEILLLLHALSASVRLGKQGGQTED